MTLEAWLKEVEKSADGLYIDGFRPESDGDLDTNYDILMAFEFGSTVQPPRPFTEGLAEAVLLGGERAFGEPEETPMRETIKKGLNEWLKIAAMEVYKTQGAFSGEKFVPLSKKTKKLKKARGVAPDPDKALIDTGQMLNALRID